MSPRFAVCRSGSFGEPAYEVRTMFDAETCEEVVDEMDGSRITIFRRDGEVVDSAGELCGVFDDRREARVHASRLEKLREVMES